jgi:hypothetical protein
MASELVSVPLGLEGVRGERGGDGVEGGFPLEAGGAIVSPSEPSVLASTVAPEFKSSGWPQEEQNFPDGET